MMDFRIAFLGEFSKDEAQIRGRYGGIPNRSDAGVFKVKITLVWRQFPLEPRRGHWPAARCCCLVNFLDSYTGGREKISQNDA